MKRINGKFVIFFVCILISFFAIVIYIHNHAITDYFDGELITERNELWNDEFSIFRQEIQLPESLDKISKSFFLFNHLQYTLYGNSHTSAKDFRIIKYDPENNVQENIYFEIYNPNEVKTTIVINQEINRKYKYYFYFGGNNLDYDYSQVFQTEFKTNKQYSRLELSDQIDKLKIELKPKSKWNLLGINNNKVIINTNANFENYKGNLIAQKEDNSFLNLDYQYNKNENIIFFNTNDLSVGKYKVYLVMKDNNKKIKSNSLEIIVSYPVFVSWTLDWEGVNVDQKFLNSVEKISSDFNVPITHFFNPRVLLNIKIPKLRKQELVKWVKERLNKGDDIAMHIHMNHDILEEAGVKPKYDAKTWDNGISGYDTPSTEYNYDEYKKILSWGLEKLQEAGFDNILGFRAGGWFVNIDNLRAIQDVGFMYDSSARVPQAIGSNKLIQNWNISYSTQPYYPNKDDQNSNSSPNMKLLQIPNNGGESYRSSAEELFSNFLFNYQPDTIAYETKLVTYLSHPEWFNIDEPKLRDLFKKLQALSLNSDAGPVVFVTHREWLKLNKFI